MPFRFRRAAAPVIRALRSERAEGCAAIHAESFAHPWSLIEFETLLASKATVGAAAVDAASDGLRGFALSRLAADEAELLTIAVRSAARNRGVGRALMVEIVARLVAARARAVFLEVERTNLPAIALYTRLGFREVGQRQGYYRKPDGSAATALVLRKDLA
ncbi:MAG: GNAT family N-acetyltransferase [Roseiarcus sp.]|jgi:ribosomal-protein-alanine N-acetyltransferase